jgi:hypothetical protein
MAAGVFVAEFEAQIAEVDYEQFELAGHVLHAARQSGFFQEVFQAINGQDIQSPLKAPMHITDEDKTDSYEEESRFLMTDYRQTKQNRFMGLFTPSRDAVGHITKALKRRGYSFNNNEFISEDISYPAILSKARKPYGKSLTVPVKAIMGLTIFGTHPEEDEHHPDMQKFLTTSPIGMYDEEIRSHELYRPLSDTVFEQLSHTAITQVVRKITARQ